MLMGTLSLIPWQSSAYYVCDFFQVIYMKFRICACVCVLVLCTLVPFFIVILHKRPKHPAVAAASTSETSAKTNNIIEATTHDGKRLLETGMPCMESVRTLMRFIQAVLFELLDQQRRPLLFVELLCILYTNLPDTNLFVVMIQYFHRCPQRSSE